MMPPPRLPEIATASRTEGKAKNTSIVRMIAMLTPAAEIAGDHAEQAADDGGERYGKNAHRQRHPTAVENAGQDVSPLLVGAQQVIVIADRLQTMRHAGLVRVHRRQFRRENRGQDDQHDQSDTEQRDVVVAEPAPNAAPINRARAGGATGRAATPRSEALATASDIAAGSVSYA